MSKEKTRWRYFVKLANPNFTLKEEKLIVLLVNILFIYKTEFCRFIGSPVPDFYNFNMDFYLIQLQLGFDINPTRIGVCFAVQPDLTAGLVWV